MTPSRWLVFAMVATAALTACGSPGYSEPEGACSAAAEWPAWLAPNPGHDGLDRDGLPTTVGGTDDCTFNKFAWQDFLALMRPQDDGGEPVFEGWIEKWTMLKGKAVIDVDSLPEGALIDYIEAGPTPNPLVDTEGEWTYYGQRVNARGEYFMNACGLTEPNCLRALTVQYSFEPGAKPPTVQYPIRYPNQSVEVKEAWKVMSAEDDPARFYTREAVVQPARAGTLGEASVVVGLVGLHIVHLTPDNRAWVWASFEHVDNAPSCADAPRLLADVDRTRKYNYFDPNCVQHCESRKQAGTVNPTIDCNTMCGAFNVYHNNGCALDINPSPSDSSQRVTIGDFMCGGDLSLTCSTSTGCFAASDTLDYYGGYYGGPNCFRADVSLSGDQVAAQRNEASRCTTAIPTQVCRAYPVGFRGVRRVDGAVIADIDTTLVRLNEELREALAGSDESWVRVLANYRLVGVQWGTPHSEEEPYWSGQIDLHGDPVLINVTLEAYIQGRMVPTDTVVSSFEKKEVRGGCLGCHGTAPAQFSWNTFKGVNFRPWRQQGFSHILDYLAAPQDEGDPEACLQAVERAEDSLRAVPGSQWKRQVLQECPLR